jgi:pimeloyl-ACP methyl ester carboxylesterase
MGKVLWLLIIGLGIGLSSCFKKYIVTEKEIRRHYDTLAVKPMYQVIKGNKFKLYTATFGADTLPPLVFIHGAPGRWEGWTKQLDDTTYHSKFHLLASDRPGYGYSHYRRRHKKVTIEKQAEIIQESLALNKSKEKAILIGRSYGAPVAAYMAAENPEKYARLIMVAPAIDPDNEKFFKFSKYGKWPVLRWFLPNRFVTAADEKYDHIEELRRIEPIWDKISIPTVVMYGGNDRIVTKENFEFAKRKLGEGENRKYIFIPEAGHRISRSHSKLLKEVIMEANL